MNNLSKIFQSIYESKSIKALIYYKEIFLLMLFLASLLFSPFKYDDKELFIKHELTEVVMPKLTDDAFFDSTSLIKVSIKNITDRKIDNLDIKISNKPKIYRITADSTAKEIQDNIYEYAKVKVRGNYYCLDNMSSLPPYAIFNIYIWGDFTINIFDHLVSNKLFIIEVKGKESEVDYYANNFQSVGVFDINNVKSGMAALIYLAAFFIIILLFRKFG